MQNYRKKVNAEKFSWLPELICRRFPLDHPKPIVQMAVCHRLLYSKFSYHHSGHYSKRPGKMVKKLSGDCQDHGVLLASMLKACGLTVSIIDIQTSSGGHIAVEIQDPLNDIDEIISELRSLYRETFDVYLEGVGYETWKGRNWLVADTAGDENSGWTRYIGQLSGYEEDGTIISEKDGSWDWKKMYGRQIVD